MKTNNLKDIDKSNPFKVPEGYFDSFTENILSSLPEKEIIETKKVNLWDQIKPWAYMAAMFAGIALMINIFVGKHVNSNETADLFSAGADSVSVAEIDAFYSYYEEQYADATYRQAFYLDETLTDTDNHSGTSN